MEVVAFDHAVAEANGYETRTDEQGREYSVKVGESGDARSPGGSCGEGDCGLSYVKINGTGNLAALLETGAGLRKTIIAYEWHVVVTDTHSVSTQNWGPRPGPMSSQLNLSKDLGSLGSGTIVAEVQSTSKATLVDGAVCVSATHADTGSVYA